MKQKPLSPLPALLCNIALLYVLYLLCRVVYVWEMWDVYAAGWGELNVGQLLWGGLRFDTAAICYTNIVWGVMVLLPIGERVRKSRCWHIVEKGLYVVVNTLALWLNLFDTVYSRYTGRRTTGSFATEFAGEGNLGSIFFTELGNHWYLVLIGIGFLAALILLYRPSKTK
ncbi:MAG: LTA synthase family protein, partial [Bacteroidales bacterium]|nr:LTA synthase family protein [Bacteroidales bacterium]